MILVDQWTLWMVAITLVQLVAIIVFRRVCRNDDERVGDTRQGTTVLAVARGPKHTR